MAVKGRFEGKPWIEWAEDIRLRWQPAMDYYRRELYFEVEYHKYLQFKFDEHWRHPHLCGAGFGGRMGKPGPLPAGQGESAHSSGGCPPGWLFAHRPALGQPALPLGSAPRDRLPVVDHPLVVLLRAVRRGSHRPLPRLRRVFLHPLRQRDRRAGPLAT